MNEITMGRLDALPDNAGTRLDIGEEHVAVFRIGDDVHAIADRCSHAEASLSEGELFGTSVECPRHGAEFDITTGRQLSLPATKPVRAFAARVVDGEVLVTINGGGNDD
jgi:3-phenylpropionate/trans-cinnamate dioxygenase ferredoxin subunit